MKKSDFFAFLIVIVLIGNSISKAQQTDNLKISKNDIESLSSERSNEQKEAVEKVRRCRSEIIQQLIKTVSAPAKVPEVDPRPLAIHLLGELRAVEALDVLVNNLETPFFMIAETPRLNMTPAAEALVMIGKPASLKVLKLIQEPNSETRQKILIEILKTIEGKEVAIFMIKKELESDRESSPHSNLEKALHILNNE